MKKEIFLKDFNNERITEYEDFYSGQLSWAIRKSKLNQRTIKKISKRVCKKEKGFFNSFFISKRNYNCKILKTPLIISDEVTSEKIRLFWGEDRKIRCIKESNIIMFEEEEFYSSFGNERSLIIDKSFSLVLAPLNLKKIKNIKFDKMDFQGKQNKLFSFQLQRRL